VTSSDEKFARAINAFNAGRLGEATRLCQALKDEAPRNADVLNLLGSIYRARGEHKKAVISLGKALAIDPLNAAFHYNIGIAVDSAGDRARALEHFRQAHKLNPKLVSADVLVGWYMQWGAANLGTDDIPSAARAFREAIYLDPRAVDIDVFAQLAPAVGIPLYEEMLRTDPHSAPIIEKLAYALFLEKQEAASRALLREVDTLCGDIVAEATHIQSIYSAGLLATRTAPLFRRRRRFAKLMEIFDRVRTLEGAIAECGCLRGLSAFALACRARDHDPNFTGEGFHIFDSFAGLSEPVAADVAGVDLRVAPNLKGGSFAASLDLVRNNLAEFPGIRLYPGWIPERFAEVSDLRFRFLNLDVDLYEPTKASIAFFYPRLVPGGVIISDDYNWPGCRTAIEEGQKEFGYVITLTDSDQAVIRKDTSY